MPSKSATWPKASIHTPHTLALQRRRFDRQAISVNAVLATMRKGASLHLSYSPRLHWRLSTGKFVTEEVARTVVAHPDIVGVGDALFAGGFSQTWRFIVEEDHNV
jgi:hypothetical protein